MPYATVNGVRLYYELEGDGQPVLLLHPIGLDLTCWDAQVPALVPCFRVLRVDLRGHGRSEVPPAPYTLAGMAHDVHELLQKLETGPAHVMGLSLGGMVAQVLALEHPADVRSLVLADTVSTLSPEARAAIVERGEAARRGGMAAVLDNTLARWFTPAFMQAPVVARCRERLLADNVEGWAGAWQAISQVETQPRLAAVRVPALVITGEADLSSPPACAEAMAAAIPGAQLHILPGAPHMAPLEQPGAFTAGVLPFLRSVAQRPPRGLLLVMIDVDPAHEAEFNRWYNEEHLPERRACPGFLSARRFIALEGEPKYLALYDLESPEVLQSPEYQKIYPPSEWTKAVSKHFLRAIRTVYAEMPEVPPGPPARPAERKGTPAGGRE
jgi:3-oxoadipate enol-lactonase